MKFRKASGRVFLFCRPKGGKYMAEDIGNLGVSIGMDATGFQSGITTINRNLKTLNSAFKMNTSEIGLNGTALDKLKLKSSNLGSVMSQQQMKVNAIEAAYNRSATATGKDSAATQNLEQRLNYAKASLSNMGNELAKTNAQITTQSSKWTTLGNSLTATSEKLKKIGSTTTDVGKKLSVGVTAPLVGIGVAAVKAGMDFEASMSNVSAMSGSTGGDLKKLNDQALQLGQDTAFSAKQAADGMADLASAGFSTEEIIQSMPGLLSLAASGNIDVATASDIAASAIRGFGLQASQTGHVADVLAQTAAGTNANVTDLGEALKYAAPPAAALGITIEETSAAIGLMSDAGIKGSDAGTALRTAFVNLAKPTTESATAMKQIGFNAFDAQGKMLPFATVISKLQNSTKGLTQEQKLNALTTIFGKESLSGMLAVVNASPGKLQSLETALKNSDGAAAKMAATMQGNAKGSIEQMMGSLETAGIKIEQSVAPTIKEIAGDVENLANKFSNLSPAVQGTIIKTALVVAAIGPVVTVVGSCITAVGFITGGLGTLSIAMGLTTAATAATGVAVAETGIAAVGASTGIGAIGLALGAALLPALPFIAAGVTIVATGVAINHAMSQQATPAVNLFADNVTTNANKIGLSNDAIGNSYGNTVTKISAGTAKAVGAYLDLSNKAQQALTTLFVNGTVITNKISTGMIAQYKVMGDTIKAGMDKHNTDEVTAMQTFFNKSSVLTKGEEAKAIGVENTNNAAKKAAVDTATKQIDTIYQTAATQHRTITATEAAQIATINDGMKTKAVSALSETEIQAKVIEARMKSYGSNITAQQAGDIIKNANTQRDGTINAANTQYSKTVAAIIKARDESHSITADQAQKLITDAGKQRDGTILAAQTQRSEVVSKLTAMNSDITSGVDTTTGNMLTKWQAFANWWNSWVPAIKNFVTTQTTNLVTASQNNAAVTTAGSMKSRANASGNNSFEGGYTTLHEKGYEVYNLPSKTKIYNHDASEDLVLKTAQAVAESVLASSQNNSSSKNQIPITFDHVTINGYPDLKKVIRDIYNIEKNYNAGIGGT